MWLKFIGCDRGSFSGGLLPFLPVCCRDRTERVSVVRTKRCYGKYYRCDGMKKPPLWAAFLVTKTFQLSRQTF
ncbi:hypothetical protein ZA08_22955 [Salmonella enterica subsp. enterica serovar Enteritidis]|nr:hypothetical protein [Salmonella enterica]ECN3634457.1 hypothetical protein [Salmonella enterica subsp. enterica serovar Enteritidis]EFB2359525.1 hypothetical protein [Escherichia coli]EFD5499502.1 hypothetical protein [Escherichia coli]EFI5463378.1 hypothetical protein [Escherichia coli]